MEPSKPIILITGANSGLGYGIARRLLQQLSTPSPSDLQGSSSPFACSRGATIILACRNSIKAHKVRTALLKSIGKKEKDDKDVEWKQERKKRILQGDNSVEGKRKLDAKEWKRAWLDGVSVEFVALDLSSVRSVLHCAKEVKQRYPYVSHLMLNAGGGPFIGLKWGYAIKRIATNIIDAVTYPDYMLESEGDKSKDGLGWTWACNVFGHYLLARELTPHLLRSPFEHPRIVFTGSIDGLEKYYDPKDWQALTGGNSYQSTKFQVGLLALGFNNLLPQLEQEYESTSEGREFPIELENEGNLPSIEFGRRGTRIKSFLVHPGIIAGNMFYDIVGFWLDICMRIAFYLARLCGSPHHSVNPLKAAQSFVIVALSSLFSLSLFVADKPKVQTDELTLVRFGARTTISGRPYLGVDPLETKKGKWWYDHWAADTIDRCEKFREEFLKTWSGSEEE
ncbi:NAD(P)-binding protein [Atractiella rhizophila]|nr:NAD(P)-binding protein [Atractiella rhizophila]